MTIETPVALLMFNRPDLTAQIFATIRQAKPRRLLVVADGPRNDKERELVEAARKEIKVDWDCDLETRYSEVNLGCKGNVSSGLDWVFERCEEAIVLEDDTLPSPSFYPFCEDPLARYREDERVWCICGMNLFTGPMARGDETYIFTRYGLTNGWASWRRAWRHYDVDMKIWPTIKQSGVMRDIFPDRVERWFWTLIFDRQFAGEIRSWDYQWLFTRLLHGGLTAAPIINMVANLGFRDDATHATKMNKRLEPAKHNHEMWEFRAPERVVPNYDVDRNYLELADRFGRMGVTYAGLKHLIQDRLSPR